MIPGKKMIDNLGYLLEWVDYAPGYFSVNDVANSLDERFIYTEKFEKLVKTGFLERHGSRRGMYRKKESDLIEMDFKNIEAHPVDLWLPFELSDEVEIYKSNIIVISGVPNAGKTAVVLNIIKENRHEWNVHYFNSEMSADELRKRLDKFPDIGIDDWNFKAYSRHENFSDVIQPGAENLNIIDFLEIHDEFYVIGKKIKEIHDKLDGAIGIICLQKNPGSDTALGGWRMMEVTRLAITIESGTVKIVKAKNFRKPDRNPNGLKRDFKLIDGCRISTRHPWYREQPKE